MQMLVRPILSRQLIRSCPALVLSCVILMLLSFELWRSYLNARHDAERNVQNLVHVLSEQTARTIQSIDLSLQGIITELASNPALADNDPGFLAELHRRLSSLPYARALFVVGEDGYISHDTDYPSTPRVSLADRSYFTVHRDDPALDLHIGTPLKSRSLDIWFVSLSRRIERADGSFAGIAVAAMEPLYFEQFYRQLWVGNGAITLFLDDGTLLARSPRDEQAVGASFASAEPFQSLLQESAGNVFWIRSPIDKVRRVAAYRALENAPLVMMVAVNEADAMQPWRSHATVAGIGAAILLAMVAGMEWLSRSYWHREERARARLAESQRLESIGRFAGGIAHDLGNLLRVLRSAVLLLRPQTAGNPDATSLLDQIDDSLVNGREMVTQLLAHSRNQPVELQEGDINQLVSTALPMLRQAAGPKISVLVSLAPGDVTCLVDHAQFRAVLLNLVLNARDAMPDGGTIGIDIEVDHEHGGGGPARQARVSIHDDGLGMSEIVRKQAFDPFFTTKEPGAGGGLGLNQARTFVEQCSGRVEIESKEGKGTTVHLWFPVIYSEASA